MDTSRINEWPKARTTAWKVVTPARKSIISLCIGDRLAKHLVREYLPGTIVTPAPNTPGIMCFEAFYDAVRYANRGNCGVIQVEGIGKGYKTCIFLTSLYNLDHFLRCYKKVGYKRALDEFYSDTSVLYDSIIFKHGVIVPETSPIIDPTN